MSSKLFGRCRPSVRLGVVAPICTRPQVAGLTEDWRARSKVPDWVEKLILNFPKDLHPMTQFSMAILALQVPIIRTIRYP